ncbi:hypothetical protein PoB_006193100 [Plakobranchus ocellatus]|uniref:Uncharacterized protein n=1 Tax=Plakobranchus ocellatus TaxID=259542 RepID=A0AAV4CU25_9GAST|nr:hypothetical protein PoB_006193100 [Plakobranchus ocellatus]
MADFNFAILLVRFLACFDQLRKHCYHVRHTDPVALSHEVRFRQHKELGFGTSEMVKYTALLNSLVNCLPSLATPTLLDGIKGGDKRSNPLPFSWLPSAYRLGRSALLVC